MQSNRRYFWIGLWVVAGFCLLIGSMFYLGLAEEFADRIYISTTFSESVQGLTKGSEVKYKGVPIGTVDRISILANEKLIRVDMSIDPRVFIGLPRGGDNEEILAFAKNFCLRERREGLCCYLELSGITGMRYIEMDYLASEKQRKQPLPEICEPDVIYFPSAPSTFNNIIDSVAVSLDKIASVDFAAIGSNVDRNLNALHLLLTDPSLKKTIENMERISENIEDISGNLSENMTGEELKHMVHGINSNLDSLNKLTLQLQQQFAAINTGELSEKIDTALYESQRLLEELRDGNSDAIHAMQQITVFLDNLNELIDQLKSDPSSLLRGKSAEPVTLD